MKVLMSAYACQPDKGSEPAAGWNWALAAARSHDVWVLTRANNRDAIEAALERSPVPSLSFEYLDLPRWARFWKRGPGGARLHYLLWQIPAGRRAARLHAEHGFDVAHHVTYANVWFPALVCRASAPFVLGPVGGGPRVPLKLYTALGWRGAVREVLLVAGRAASRLNPWTRRSWERATVILAQNEETVRALPSKYRAKILVRPHASVDLCEIPQVPRTASPAPVAMYAGRLVPWKGAVLAVEALADLPKWTLLVVGTGPDAARVQRAASRAGVSGRVRVLPWLPRRELWSLMSGCSALVLPSLRDDAPFVVAEAQALGVPVVAFAQGGPAILAAKPGAQIELVQLGSRRSAATGLAQALRRVESLPRVACDGFGLTGVQHDLDALYRRVATPPLEKLGRAAR